MLTARLIENNKFIIVEGNPDELAQVRLSFTKKINSWYIIKSKNPDANVDESFMNSVGMIPVGLWAELINTCNPNNGITFDITGTIIFKGKAIFANDSYIMIRDNGKLILGNDIDCNCKIKCAKSIEIGDETWVAYETMIMDSDWHALTDMCTGKLLKKTDPVRIGKHNFISYKCIVTKGTVTPDNATFMPCSTLNKVYEEGEYPLFGGNPCELKDEGFYMDHKNN